MSILKMIQLNNSHTVDVVEFEDGSTALTFFDCEILLFSIHNDFGKDINKEIAFRYLIAYRVGVTQGINKGRSKLQYQIKNLLDIN